MFASLFVAIYGGKFFLDRMLAFWLGLSCVFIKPEFISFLVVTLGSGDFYFAMVPCKSAPLSEPASLGVLAFFIVAIFGGTEVSERML